MEYPFSDWINRPFAANGHNLSTAGTSKTKQIVFVLDVPVHTCTAHSPAWWILYHVTFKGPIVPRTLGRKTNLQ